MDIHQEHPLGLRLGARGSEVQEMQRVLRAVGYEIEPDGIFGRMTDAALRSYQASRELPNHGVLTPETWERLDRETTIIKEKKP